MRIDLNSDLGESFGAYRIGHDEAIMQYVSSANIACGFHAGDPATMRSAVKQAMNAGVSIGAHPGLPDLMGFGRRAMQISPDELKAYVIYQVGALAAFVKAEGGQLQHVKLHGALYNMAADDVTLARAFCEAVCAVDDHLTILALSGSQMIHEARTMSLKTASEVFADRRYTNEGRLVSRHSPGAVLDNRADILNQVLDMVANHNVMAADGSRVQLEVDSICLHGDHPEAVSLSQSIREMLLNNGCVIESLGRKGVR